MITIVLVDDHHLVRQGLRALLETEPDFTVIDEMDSGLGVAEFVEQTKPNILVIDLMMSGLNGLEVARQITQRKLETRVIILSMHSEEAYVLQALTNGAMGYVLKESRASDLVEAIHTALAGRRYLSPPLSERAIEAYMNRTPNATTDPYEHLTMREREVLQLAAEGYTSPEIGEQLSISARTVEVHRASLMRKLTLRNQSELIRYALRRGILPSDNVAGTT
jgi:two-component system, NarL family, response regulator NreC